MSISDFAAQYEAATRQFLELITSLSQSELDLSDAEG
jgi:hypothetical protein